VSFSLFFYLLKQTSQAWLDNKAARLGAALAFYSVLSLSPLLVLILAVASALWGTQAALGHILDQMETLIGGQGAEIIRNILDAAGTNKSAGFIAGLIGFASLLFSASAVFGELQDAMNIIWHAPPSKGKPALTFLKERTISVIMVIGCSSLLLLSVIISAALAATSKYVTDIVPTAILIMHLINFLVSFGIVTALFALIFKTVPGVAVRWSSVWPGAILTAVLFIIGKGLIGLYLGHAGIASGYGAAGSIVVLLVWIYYSAQILFFGAEFAYVYSRHFKLNKNLP